MNRRNIITGSTPLEERLYQERPRLFLNRARLEELKELHTREPYAGMFRRVIQLCEEAAERGFPRAEGGATIGRGRGTVMPSLALAHHLSGEEKYLELARESMLAAVSYDSWGESLEYGEAAFGLAVAYDWLHAELDRETLGKVRHALHVIGSERLQFIGLNSGWLANVYTCNHLAVVMAGLVASAGALYNDCDDIAPWVRMCAEKLRTMALALGDDGVSQEGASYGAFYALHFIKAAVLIQELTGEDLFQRSEWLRNLSTFYLYSALPGEGHPIGSGFLKFGDGARGHWHGLDIQLRKLASVYGDPAAQWHADILTETGYGLDQSAFLNLVWFDPEVRPEPPDLPTLRHFTDKDLVLGRSNWTPDAEVFGLKCGPHFGHHALRHYAHDIGGGHMCPDAGSFQLFSHGDRLIVDPDYKAKWTRYQNTMLINGQGQTGEGGVWFEGIQLRREKRGPKILRVESCKAHDRIIADATQAYGAETGLKKFVRHFIYLKPSCWIVADELEADSSSTFELYFHAEQPFEPQGDGSFRATGPNGSLLVRSLTPGPVSAKAFTQEIAGTGSVHADDQLEALVLSNPEKATNAFFLTGLCAFPTGAETLPELSATVNDGLQVSLNGRDYRFEI